MANTSEARWRAIVYCIVPRDLAGRLHEPLRRHFAADPGVEVVVEQRGSERRQCRERRVEPVDRADDRRRIRATEGRRVGDRRAVQVPVEAQALPRRAQRHLDRLVFVECIEPSSEQLEDRDTARLVMRIQSGDRDGFGELYTRYFNRVYGYLVVALGDPHDAEDVTQQVFMRILEALPRYQRSGSKPFRAWLFAIVRNHAISRLRDTNRLEAMDPDELSSRRADEPDPEDLDLSALSWITDRELLMFIERLPLAQRQVLLLRYMLDLPYREISEILGRSQSDVTMLQSRAVRFLRARLAAIGRGPHQPSERSRMLRVPQKARVLRRRRYALIA